MSWMSVTQYLEDFLPDDGYDVIVLLRVGAEDGLAVGTAVGGNGTRCKTKAELNFDVF